MSIYTLKKKKHKLMSFMTELLNTPGPPAGGEGKLTVYRDVIIELMVAGTIHHY
jgi:hypothetical protein